MNNKSPTVEWQAVAFSKNIKSKPYQVWVANKPIVFFRTKKGLHALYDRCPHRMVELSTGKIRDDTIECPYHGWRFNDAGKCVYLPGLLGQTPKINIKSFSVIEKGGIVFIAEKPSPLAPYLHPMENGDIVVRHVSSRTQSTVLDVVENILDATHTHFTHKGILRGLNSKRFRVKVEVTGGFGWVEACYTGEEKQQGLVSKILEGERTKTIGRFRYPGIAELEFWGPHGLELATTFHLRQSTKETVDGIGLIIGPKKKGLGYLKAILFMPFFKIALWQDRVILAAASNNAKKFPIVKPVIGPLDFLRKDIVRIMAGSRPEAASKPQTYYLEL